MEYELILKQLNREMFDQFCNANLAAIIAGLGKIFVAEVIEIGASSVTRSFSQDSTPIVASSAGYPDALTSSESFSRSRS